MVNIQKKKVAQTTKITIVGFFLLIIIGGILLNLPACNTRETTFLDSIFTAAGAICVAGLSTEPITEQYTLLGKTIMLILIQIGALGFILVMSAFYLLFKRKMTYKEQLVIGETLGTEGDLERVKKLIKKVVKYTAITEVLGAIVLCIRFVPIFGLAEGIGQAIFTSVSAFCNCGYDFFGELRIFTIYI